MSLRRRARRQSFSPWDARETEFRTCVEGIVEALDRIAIPTCVASSGSHEKMRFTLGLTGSCDRFHGRIFSATDVPRGKPEPDLFLHAAERMGVAPADCVVEAAPTVWLPLARPACGYSATPAASLRRRS